jgi:hypothetical protein
VIDIPTYASPNLNRWPIEQRQNMAAAIQDVAKTSFASTAEPYPIVIWPKRAYWITITVIALLLGGLPLIPRIGRSQ